MASHPNKRLAFDGKDDCAPPAKRARHDHDYHHNSDSNNLHQLSAPSMDQKLIAKHYGERSDGHLEARESSSIIQLRKINNWVKSLLIGQFCHCKAVVLDIGAGKGGDLNKWNHQQIDELVHVDHALGSIMDCRQRYNEGIGKNRLNFGITLICADAFSQSLREILDRDLHFDIVSSQFALHYAFETQERVHAMLTNVTARLREDGYFIGTIPDGNVLVQKWRAKAPDIHTFGNDKYKVSFKCDTAHHPGMDKKKLGNLAQPYAIRYMFNLNDAVDCPEYLLHFDHFVKLAAQPPYNLELVYDCNFHEFFVRNYNDNANRKLLQKIGILDNVHSDQWDIAYLYKVFVFKKKNLENIEYPVRVDKIPTEITETDVKVCH